MLLIIKFLAKAFSVLNSEISPRQIACGFAYGVILGLLPAFGMLSTLFLLLAFIINFNLTAVLLAAAIFKIFSFAIDPLANQLGFFLLTKIPPLTPLWTALFNVPLVPYTRFNNTIVMGSLAIGVLAFVPMYFLAKSFVANYRIKWMPILMRLKIVQVVKASSFYKYYESYRGLTGQ